MKIIGAVINTSVDGIDGMIEARDEKKLIELAKMQIGFGAEMLAINCGTRLATEPEDIRWMFQTIQNELEIPLCIDSPNPEAHRAGLEVHRHGRALVDSITGEQKRIDAIMPLVAAHNAQVVAILQNEKTPPEDIHGRLAVIPRVLEAADKFGVAQKDIYIDSMVFPLSVDGKNGELYFETMRRVREQYPELKTICGLNNISYGLPAEDLINSAFAVSCAARGQDAIFIEITKGSAAVLRALKILEGKDEYAVEYLGAFRRGELAVFSN